MPTALDSLVRRIDEDRWLASRFAPQAARARLIALYAVNYEIARTGEVVREASLSDIRLQWWRDALSAIADGGAPREHPALQALAVAFPAAASGLRAIADARCVDFDPAPFADWAELERYLDATAGALMRLAVEACAPEASAAMAGLVKSAALAWGLVGLARARPFLQARGRSLHPRQAGADESMLARAEAAYATAHALPAPVGAAFPAVGYAALLPLYVGALHRARGEPPLLARQLRLIASAATARL